MSLPGTAEYRACMVDLMSLDPSSDGRDVRIHQRPDWLPKVELEEGLARPSISMRSSSLRESDIRRLVIPLRFREAQDFELVPLASSHECCLQETTSRI